LVTFVPNLDGSVKDQPEPVSTINRSYVKHQPEPKRQASSGVNSRFVGLKASAEVEKSSLSRRAYSRFVGPVGLEPTTRGLKGAGMASVEIHGRLTGHLISYADVPESGGVAVSAAVKNEASP
jgi:hypothetical protein